MRRIVIVNPESRLRRWRAGWLALVAIPIALVLAPPAAAEIEPSTGHPRIIIREQDLPELRTWTVPGNPIWQRLRTAGEQALAQVSDGNPATGPGAPASGCTGCEDYAGILSLMSLLVADDPATPTDEPRAYAEHSRNVVMGMIGELDACRAAGNPSPNTALCRSALLSDRGRWDLPGLILAIDQIQHHPGVLSTADRDQIRAVFRWLAERLIREPINNYRPDPPGVLNDPQLVANHRDRWAGNNHWAAHMRSVALMALVFDPDAGEDPPMADPQFAWEPNQYQSFDLPYSYSRLSDYLENVAGAWLYMSESLYNGGAAGGIFPEGPYYGASTGGFTLQTLLALHTAGEADTAEWGSPVGLMDSPFWSQMVDGYLHHLPSTGYEHPWYGQMHQPALHGDIDNRYEATDWIEPMGSLGVFDRLNGGNAGRLEAARYIQTHLVRGGAGQLAGRVLGSTNHFSYMSVLPSTLYFLLFDPNAAPPADPRPGMATEHLAAGLGRLYARTGWGPASRLFTFGSGYHSVEHMHGDGGDFGLWRKGEWLTRQRSAYANWDSSQHNTLAIENDPPASNTGMRRVVWLRGSQFAQYHLGDSRLERSSFGDGYAYALGEMTDAYNNPAQAMNDVEHASRSIVWLKPDIAVVHDRARTSTGNRFKRWWLQLAGTAQINQAAKRLAMTTPGGQRLYGTVLAPANAELALVANDAAGVNENYGSEGFAGGGFTGVDLDVVERRFRVEAPGGPADVRFLNVLEGADAGAAPSYTTRVSSVAGMAYEGAIAGETAVMFPRNVGGFTATTYRVPAGELDHVVTGLEPGAGYDFSVTDAPDGRVDVTVEPGQALNADSGGVIRFSAGAGELDTAPPRLALQAKKRQRLGRVIRGTARCDERCAVALRGTIKPRGQKRKLKLRRANLALQASTTGRWKLRLNRRALAKLEAAGAGRVAIAGTATDANGNRATARARVKVR